MSSTNYLGFGKGAPTTSWVLQPKNRGQSSWWKQTTTTPGGYTPNANYQIPIPRGNPIAGLAPQAQARSMAVSPLNMGSIGGAMRMQSPAAQASLMSTQNQMRSQMGNQNLANMNYFLSTAGPEAQAANQQLYGETNLAHAGVLRNRDQLINQAGLLEQQRRNDLARMIMNFA